MFAILQCLQTYYAIIITTTTTVIIIIYIKTVK